MKYRSLGDDSLKNSLEKAAKNANYRSSTIQAEIIELIGSMTMKQIIEKVKRSKFYAIGFDETMDISKSEQIALTFRYLDYSSGAVQIKEDFITFINAFETLKFISPDEEFPSLTGKNLAMIIIDWLKRNGLEMKLLVSIITDGASVMTSEKIGAVKFIKGD